ncbi:MAG: GNAT family N-acetyltransferase [Cyclobacteriaceae bacterium]
MQRSKVKVRRGTIEEAVSLSRLIPEFENPAGAETYRSRLEGRDHLILIAELDQPCGFKVGYNREADGSFYSWMGGVLPDYRRHRVAQALADEMETYCRTTGYAYIRMKTRNEHKAMLQFALHNGFHLIGFKAYSDLMKSRILLEKKL